MKPEPERELESFFDEKNTIGVNVKKRLSNLEQYMPDQDESIYEFAKFLSGRVHEGLVPAGLTMVAALALYDLQVGIDGFSQKPIQGKLVGQPPVFYGILDQYIPLIVKAISSKEYTDSVNAFRRKVSSELSKPKD